MSNTILISESRSSRNGTAVFWLKIDKCVANGFAPTSYDFHLDGTTCLSVLIVAALKVH